MNEVVPRDELIERANELARNILKQERTTRRLTTQVIRRPWKKRITDDLDGGFGIQMFAHLAKSRALHVGVDAEGAGEDSYFARLLKVVGGSR